MSEPYFLMKFKNGDEFNIADKISGLRYLGEDLSSASPQFTNNYQELSGVDGSFFASQSLAKKTITEKFWLHFTTYENFILARQQIYHLFGTRNYVRIRTDVNPYKVYYGYVTPFSINPINPGMNDVNFSLVFDVPDGVKYSMYSCDDLVTNHASDGIQFGFNLWQEDELPTYSFSGNSFQVFNAGDIAVDPYQQKHQLKISFDYSGNSIKLTNTTNNTSWKYNNSSSDTITLNGLNAYKGTDNVNSNTDYGYISLEPGWNQFTVEGADSSKISFSFPFIYLE